MTPKDSPQTGSAALTPADIADFKKLKDQAIENFNKASQNYQKCAEQLLVIKRRELWRAEKHPNWTAFLDHIAEKLDKTPRRLFQIVREAETRFKLLKSFQQKSPNLRKIVENMKPEALREISKKPEEERAVIIEIASKQCDNQAPTAPAISAASKVHKSDLNTRDKSTWPKDVSGTLVPPSAWPFWERRTEVQPYMTKISEVKCAIEKAREAGDSIYSWIGNEVFVNLQNAYNAISKAKLCHVCTKCQGWWDRMGGGGCSSCKNTGLINADHYAICSPKEIKALREKANRANL